MENQQKTHGTIVAANPQKEILPITQNVFKELTDISTKIGQDKEDILKQLEQIRNLKKPIDIKRHWYGTDKESIKKAIGGVSSDIRDFAGACEKAFISQSDNMSNILRLLMWITNVEVDLYKLIDNQSVEGNEFKNLIRDWCKEHGIKDEEIEKLLNSSVQRAYTLRDRIENLRNDCNLKIGQNSKDLEEIKQYLSNYDHVIQEKVAEVKRLLNEEVEEHKAGLNDEFRKKQEEFSELHNQLERKISENRNEIDATFKKIVEQKEDLRQQHETQKELLSSIIEDHRAAIETKNQEFSQNIEKLRESCHSDFSNQKDALQGCITIFENRLQEFCEQQENASSKQKEELCNLQKNIKRWIVWGGIAIIGISSVACTIINIVL